MNETTPRPPGVRRSDHARKVSLAHTEFGVLADRWRDKHGLTDIETLQGLTSYMQSTLKFALRAERHPEAPDTPADEDTGPDLELTTQPNPGFPERYPSGADSVLTEDGSLPEADQ